MNIQKFLQCTIVTTMLSLSLPVSANGVYITEWMYNDVEFVEFTNLSSTVVDFTGWSFDDNSRLPGVLDLSSFGLVGAGESVIITETSAADFRLNWNLDSSVKVLGEYTNNLGRNDEINLYDNLGNLIDRLTYGDQDFAGTPRTVNTSGRPVSDAALGANDIYQWAFSALGDADGSYYSINGELGSPAITAVPVPAAIWLMLSGLLGLAGVQRRKQHGNNKMLQA